MPGSPRLRPAGHSTCTGGAHRHTASVIEETHWGRRIMGRPQGMDSLEPYRQKRNRGRTPEPMPDAPDDPGTPGAPGAADTEGAAADGGQEPGERPAGVFVVQEHHA